MPPNGWPKPPSMKPRPTPPDPVNHLQLQAPGPLAGRFSVRMAVRTAGQ